jgi:hypothetical protein
MSKKMTVELPDDLHGKLLNASKDSPGKISGALLAGARLWLIERERARPADNALSKDILAKEYEITHSEGAVIQTLASEIGERAAAILQIAEKVKGSEVGENTIVSTAKKMSTTDQELSERLDRIIIDTAEIPDDIAEIKEQLGGSERDRKGPHRKVSGR